MARNIGFNEASQCADILGFTDDDCRLPPDWIPQVAAEFAADPDLDALLGRILPLQDKEGAIAVLTACSKRRMIFNELPNPLVVNLFEHGSWLYALSRIRIYVLRPFLHGLVRLSPRRLRRSWSALQAARRGIRIAKERYQVAKG